MINKIRTIIETTRMEGKKKVAAIVVCGALALTLGTSAAFTANAANENEKMLSRVDNGVRTFPTDDGKTWNGDTPIGFKESINEDGSVTSIVGNPPDDGSSMMVQNKNGAIKYSEDGGKTWSDKAPTGVKTTVNADGSVSVKSR